MWMIATIIPQKKVIETWTNYNVEVLALTELYQDG